MYMIHDLRALAAKYGKHVLMEKPIARTVAEARELINRYFPYWESSGSMGSPNEMGAS